MRSSFREISRRAVSSRAFPGTRLFAERVSYPMNRRYRVRVPSMRSAMNFIRASSRADRLPDLDGLPAFAAPVPLQPAELHVVPRPLDEERPALRTVGVLEGMAGDVPQVRKPDPEFPRPPADLLEGRHRGRLPVLHPVVGMEPG